MKKIYLFSGKNPRVFLVLNTVFWSILALAVSVCGSLLFGRTLRGNMETIACITGYAGFFVGFLGGALYLGRNDLDGCSGRERQERTPEQ